jgi:hypothetical protein
MANQIEMMFHSALTNLIESGGTCYPDCRWFRNNGIG